MRSYSWNLGTVREIGGGVKDLFTKPSSASMASPDDPYDAAMTNLNRAGVAFAGGDRDRAMACLGAAQVATMRELVLGPLKALAGRRSGQPNGEAA